MEPTLDDVLAARARIAPFIRHTPLEPSPALSGICGIPVLLKLECWQHTGSFKPRVSFSKLLALPEDLRRRGVVASTAGGHGIGLSYAARALGVPCTICLPRSADPRKVEVIRRQGAELRSFGSVEEARAEALRLAGAMGWTFVSAYNDPDVVAGGGTVGLEIAEDAPEVDLVVVGMGGGGLASGMGLALGDRAQVWGVQSEVNAVLAAWLDAGAPVPVETAPSIADGLGARLEEDAITFPLARRLVKLTLRVSEAEIRAAVGFLLEEHQMVVEPSGAAPVAALRKADLSGFRSAAVVVTGRNVSRDRYLGLML